jgi:hypothetical protein
MKARFFYAPQIFSTWPKLFILTEDGKLYTEYLYRFNLIKLEQQVDFVNFNSDAFKFEGYQPLQEITQDEALQVQLVKQNNWIQSYLLRKIQVLPDNVNDNKSTLEILIEKNIPFCFNEQEYDYSKLKYIIVGDNPGNLEYTTNQFFIGPSGQELRNHFLENGLIHDFDEECIIFNKTYIHTKKTEHLLKVRERIGYSLFDQIQEDCANEIIKISNEYKLPILIFGKNHIKPTRLFEKFWTSLSNGIDDTARIFVFKHPSYNHFKNDWDMALELYPNLSPVELLFEIGKKNTEEITTLFHY